MNVQNSSDKEGKKDLSEIHLFHKCDMHPPARILYLK